MPSHRVLERETLAFQGTGGVSAESRGLGFRPAFLDRASGILYLARFADGRPAPMHVLDGLPPHLVTCRGETGRVLAVRDSVVAGFQRDGRFYSREEAAAAAASADAAGSSRHAA
jgi:hypothetical protein